MDLTWKRDGACRPLSPDLFFPVGETGPAVVQILHAKAVCATCPVRIRCRNYALTRPEAHGIWGGLDEKERRHVLARASRRGMSPLEFLYAGAA